MEIEEHDPGSTCRAWPRSFRAAQPPFAPQDRPLPVQHDRHSVGTRDLSSNTASCAQGDAVRTSGGITALEEVPAAPGAAACMGQQMRMSTQDVNPSITCHPVLKDANCDTQTCYKGEAFVCRLHFYPYLHHVSRKKKALEDTR